MASLTSNLLICNFKYFDLFVVGFPNFKHFDLFVVGFPNFKLQTVAFIFLTRIFSATTEAKFLQKPKKPKNHQISIIAMIKLIIFLLTHNRAIKEGGRGERAIKSIHCWRGTNGCLCGKRTNKITICKTQITIHGTKVCLEGKKFISVLFKLHFASLC